MWLSWRSVEKTLGTTKHSTVSGAAVPFVLVVDLLLAAGPVPHTAHGGDRAPATPDLRRPEIPAFSGLYPPFPQLLRHPHRLHRGSEADQPGVHDGKVGAPQS